MRKLFSLISSRIAGMIAGRIARAMCYEDLPAWVERHVAGCETCRAEAEAYAKLTASLAPHTQDEPACPVSWDQMRSRLHERPAAARPVWLGTPAKAAAACVVILAAAALILPFVAGEKPQTAEVPPTSDALRAPVEKPSVRVECPASPNSLPDDAAAAVQQADSQTEDKPAPSLEPKPTALQAKSIKARTQPHRSHRPAKSTRKKTAEPKAADTTPEPKPEPKKDDKPVYAVVGVEQFVIGIIEPTKEETDTVDYTIQQVPASRDMCYASL